MKTPNELEKLHSFFKLILLTKPILKKKRLKLPKNVSSFRLKRLKSIVNKKK